MPAPKKNVAYSDIITLMDASARPDLKAAPTLAAGDVQVSTDEGAYANITTLPTVSPAGSVSVKYSLSASEMNGDRIAIKFIDQTSPKEWDDVLIGIDTTAVTVDDLVRATTPANALDVTATGAAGIDWGNVENKTAVNDLSNTDLNLCDTVTANTDMRGTDSAALATALATAQSAIDVVDANVDAVLIDTAELQTDNVPGLIAALNDVAATDIVSAGAITTLTGAVVNVDTVDTCTTNTDMRGTDGANTTVPDNASITAILADTNELQIDDIPATLATIAGYIDTEISTIITNLATAQADLDIVTGADGATLSSASEAAAVVAFWSDTLTTYTNGQAGKRLKGLSAAIVVEGTVNDASATTLSFISDLTGYGIDFFVDTEIQVEISTDKWQPRVVTAYNTTTGEMTVDEPFISAPPNTAKIALTMRHVHSISSINAEIDTAISDAALATEAKQDIITAEIGTAGAGLTDLGGMSAGMKAEINTEILDVLITDTFAELSAIPAATASLKDKITFLYMLARNQVEQTSTTKTLRADNTTTVVGASTASDDGTTFIDGEMS